MIRFVHPEFVGVALAVLLAGLALGRGLAWRRKARLKGVQGRRGGPDLAVPPEPGRERLKWGLCVGALVLGCLAAARPVGGLLPGAETQRKSLRMVVVVDVSRSMLARDGGERSRLERSGEAFRLLLREAAGDEVGLVVFRGGAASVTAPTRDLAALERLSDLLSPNMMGLEGSRFEDALELALKGLDLSPGVPGVIWLLTDGEWHEGSPELEARRIALAGVRLVVAGVGDPAGSPIPVKTSQGMEVDFRYKGQRVITRLDGARLERLARAAGGRVIRLERPEQLAELYRESFEPLRTVTLSENPEDYRGYGWIPLLAALLLALWDWVLPWRIRLPRGIAPGVWVLALGAGGLLWAPPVRAAERPEDKVKAMELAWDRGEMAEARGIAREALEQYPGEVTVLYNYGLAAYRVEDYETAALAWERVRSEFPRFRAERVAFQIGNARLRLSLEREADALEAKEFDLRAAKEAQEVAAEGGVRGAEHNQTFTRRLLAEVLFRRGEAEVARARLQERNPRWSRAVEPLDTLRDSVRLLEEGAELDAERADIRERRDEVKEMLAAYAEALANRRMAEGAAEAAGAAKEDGFQEMAEAAEGLAKMSEAAALAEEAAEQMPTAEREALAEAFRERERAMRRDVGDAWMDSAAAALDEGRTPAQSLRKFEEGLAQMEAAVEDGGENAAEQAALQERQEQLAEYREAHGDRMRTEAEEREGAARAEFLAAAAEQFERAQELAEASGAAQETLERLEEKSGETQEALDEALVAHAESLLQEAAARQEAGAFEEALGKVDEAVGQLTRASEQAEGVAEAMAEAFEKRNEIQAAMPPEGDEYGSDPGEGEGAGLEGRAPDEVDPDLPPPLLFQGQESRGDTQRSEAGLPW